MLCPCYSARHYVPSTSPRTSTFILDSRPVKLDLVHIGDHEPGKEITRTEAKTFAVKLNRTAFSFLRFLCRTDQGQCQIEGGSMPASTIALRR
jgi:hypothetical protein